MSIKEMNVYTISSETNAITSTPREILLVEDEADIAGLIELHLNDLNYKVTRCADGHEALRRGTMQRWDLIMLDIRLPGIDGLEVCRGVRKVNSTVPILMLTSKSSELDRVLGLEIGADDYVTKPFSINELIARVKGIFRRSDAAKQLNQEAQDGRKQTRYELDAFRLDTVRRIASVADKQLDLTAKEFELLLHFVSNPGRVYKRTELLDSVWGYGHDGYEHTVNSHINRLRAKIEVDPARPKYIVTVWGVGYKLALEA